MCVASCDDKVVILEVNSTEGLFGHRVVPSCPLPVMKIKCERFIFIFFCHYWKRHLKQQRFLNFFLFQVSDKDMSFRPPGCLQSQQDCVVRPLGGRQRYCCFIRYEARRQSAQGGNGKFRPKGQQTLPSLPV